MSKHSRTIDLTPVKRETLSPAEFLSLAKQRPHTIFRSRFIAPTVGGRDFGGFEVEYTIPQLKMQSEPA